MGAEEVVRRMYADGQHRWPSIELDFGSFRRHCLRIAGTEPTSSIEHHGVELYLCCACAARNPRATLAFERQASQIARAAVGRVNRDPDFVEETLRKLWDKLLYSADPKVAEYSARGPLLAWVRVAAVRTAIDEARSTRQAMTRYAELGEWFGAGGAGPESALTRAHYAEAFQGALERALAGLSAQDRNLLRMHVLDRCSIDQIGRAHSVHRATAARWLERARARILKAVRAEVAVEHASLTDSEFLSIAHIMGPELELSLDSALRAGGDGPEAAL
jgi:RNA polymerase sigma-70 factor (ECF subfamily)